MIRLSNRPLCSLIPPQAPFATAIYRSASCERAVRRCLRSIPKTNVGRILQPIGAARESGHPLEPPSRDKGSTRTVPLISFVPLFSESKGLQIVLRVADRETGFHRSKRKAHMHECSELQARGEQISLLTRLTGRSVSARCDRAGGRNARCKARHCHRL